MILFQTNEIDFLFFPQVGEPGDDGYPYVQQNYPNQPQINEPGDTPDGTDAPDMPDYNGMSPAGNKRINITPKHKHEQSALQKS